MPIYNLMEDAATAEICRAQIWQQIKYGVKLENGVTVTRDFFERALREEMQRVEEKSARTSMPKAALRKRLNCSARFR